jgi:hypothetical protein
MSWKGSRNAAINVIKCSSKYSRVSLRLVVGVLRADSKETNIKPKLYKS